MSTTFTLITSLFFGFFDVFAYYHILMNKLTYRFKHHTRFYFFVAIYLLYYSAVVVSELIPHIPLKLPILFATYFLMLIAFEEKLIKRVFWIITTVLIIIVSELITLPTCMIILHSSLEELLATPFSYCLINICSRALLLLLSQLITRSKRANIQILNSFSRELLLIILIDVVFALLISCLFYYGNMFITPDTAIGFSLLVVLVISILAIYILFKVAKKSEEVMTTNLKLQQIEMENKLNQDISHLVESLRSLRHDMNNHLGILQGLLSMKEYKEAAEYLTSITEELKVANNFIVIDNRVLSVLINNKLTKAAELNIPFETEIQTNNFPLDDKDLCALVGNILENALEATAHHTEPYIFFSMKTQNNQLLITCDNTYSIHPIMENGNFITIKENKSYHGIGTKTIKSITDSYHGSITFSVDDQFHVRISIPLS